MGGFCHGLSSLQLWREPQPMCTISLGLYQQSRTTDRSRLLAGHRLMRVGGLWGLPDPAAAFPGVRSPAPWVLPLFCRGAVSLGQPPPRVSSCPLEFGKWSRWSLSPPLQESLAEHLAQATCAAALLCLPLLLSWKETALVKRKKLLFPPKPP